MAGKVYKCQNPKNKQCSFFLWESEAKFREEDILGSGSRSETHPPETPPRNNPYRTPTSNARQSLTRSTQFNTPSKPPRHLTPTPTAHISLGPTQARKGWSDDDGDDEDGEEFFDWPLSDEEVMVPPYQAEDEAMQRTAPKPQPPRPPTTYMPPSQTPRKAPRTATTTSPSKRSRSPSPTAFPTPITTPANRTLFTKQDANPLASEILALLESHSISLPPATTIALTQICTTHTLRAQGIARGRDVSRDALREKEKVVRELRQRMQELEAERERDRVVIGSLRRERLGRVGGGMGDAGERERGW
ncbi:MAG: hypothetical protein M1840_008415 [Geoglossum simile]|nr:MAG: hypothetical protein M1840_008415 [Geoglossum simile]